MAERNKKGAGKGRKKDVIDVGEAVDKEEGEAEENSEAEDAEPEAREEGLDADLVSASAAIDVGDEGHAETEAEHEPPARAPRSTGSLARRDPLGVYMSETRRYPLLTPEEEHALAVRLVEHGDS